MADNDDPNKSEGRFQLNLTNFAQYGKRWYDQEVFSESMMIRGLPWRLMAVTSTFSKKRYFGLFLKCNDQSDDVGWSCKAKATLRIHSMTKGKEDFQFEFEKNFTADCKDQGSFQVKEFEELANPQNGWLDDEDALFVSADIKAEPAHGMHFNNTMHGNDSIILNGTKFNVNKNHLLFYAPSFEPYFSPQRGIQLDRQLATVEDFKRMIAALPPQNRPLDDECIEAIMYLANRFSVGVVEGICRNYLAKNCKKSQIFKYRLATKYGFDLLKDRILKNITKKEVEEDIVQNLVEYRKLEKEDDANALIARISLIFGPNLKNNSKEFIFGSILNKNSTSFVFGGNLKSIAEVNGESPESNSSNDSDSSDNSNDDGEPALKRARQAI